MGGRAFDRRPAQLFDKKGITCRLGYNLLAHWPTGSCAAARHGCTTARLSCGVRRGSATWVHCECREPGRLIPRPVGREQEHGGMPASRSTSDASQASEVGRSSAILHRQDQGLLLTAD